MAIQECIFMTIPMELGTPSLFPAIQMFITSIRK